MQLPPNPAPYLVEWLFEIGPAADGAFGAGAMRLADIAADLAVSGIEVLPWEALILRRMSGAYCNELAEARDEARPPPWSGVSSELDERRAIVAKKVDAMFRNMKGKR